MWGLILSSAVWTALPVSVDVETLSGRVASGTIEQFSANQLVLSSPSDPVTFAVKELLTMQVVTDRPPAASGATAAEGANVAVAFRDGSQLQFSQFTVANRRVTAQHPLLKAFEAGVDRVRSVRLAAFDPAVQNHWEQLLARDSKQDLLVVRKGAVLDFLDGVVGDIDDTSVKFLLQGDDVVLKRNRVFGIIYAPSKTPQPKALVKVELEQGELLMVKRVQASSDGWLLDDAGGKSWTLPLTSLRAVDFSAGKVQYLSAMEPRGLQHTPFWGTRWELQRDRGFEGRPLMVGPRQFRRGLAMHSKTAATYRLGGEYRRFVATVGIDPEVNGDARLIIRADGKELLAKDVVTGDPPLPVDLPVDGVTELELIVDYGRDLDFGDRVHFGDAKVLK
jgi:hypothetical protein